MTMSLQELREKLSQPLEDGVAESADPAAPSTTPSRPSTTVTSSAEGERDTSGGVLRHCRSCRHVRVSEMPIVPVAGQRLLTVQTVSNLGHIYQIPLERTANKSFGACSKGYWEGGISICNPDQLDANHGYFREQANLCADYELDKHRNT